MKKFRNTVNGSGGIARVIFNDDEVSKLNDMLDLIRRFGGNVTPNGLLKQLSLQKAKEDLYCETT